MKKCESWFPVWITLPEYQRHAENWYLKETVWGANVSNQIYHVHHFASAGVFKNTFTETLIRYTMNLQLSIFFLLFCLFVTHTMILRYNFDIMCLIFGFDISWGVGKLFRGLLGYCWSVKANESSCKVWCFYPLCNVNINKLPTSTQVISESVGNYPYMGHYHIIIYVAHTHYQMDTKLGIKCDGRATPN